MTSPLRILVVDDHPIFRAETVKEYLSHAMVKLRANNRTHAIAIALERGFLR